MKRTLLMLIALLLGVTAACADDYMPKRKPGETWVKVTRMGDLKPFDAATKTLEARVGEVGPKAVKPGGTVTLMLGPKTPFFDVKGGDRGKPKRVQLSPDQLDAHQKETKGNIIFVGKMKGSQFIVSSAYFSYF